MKFLSPWSLRHVLPSTVAQLPTPFYYLIRRCIFNATYPLLPTPPNVSQMKKTTTMNTPARRRLQSRFSEIVPTDAGDADATGAEPSQTPLESDKPTATRVRNTRAKPTAKKTKTARQKKQKGAAPSGPETEPLHETTPVPPQNPTQDVGPPPITKPSTRTAKKAPPPPKQGTRASARLRGQNAKTTQEPAPIEPKTQKTKRKLEPVAETKNETTAVKPRNKRAKATEDQADTQVQPAQPEGTTNDDPPVRPAATPVEPATTENTTVDDPEDPANVSDEADTSTHDCEDCFEDENELIRRFYIRKDEYGKPAGICLGLFTRESYARYLEENK